MTFSTVPNTTPCMGAMCSTRSNSNSGNMPESVKEWGDLLQQHWWHMVDACEYTNDPQFFYRLTQEVHTWFVQHPETDRNELHQSLSEGLSCAIMRVHPFLAMCCVWLDEAVLLGGARCRERLLQLKYSSVRDTWKTLQPFDHQHHSADVSQLLDLNWAHLYQVAVADGVY